MSMLLALPLTGFFIALLVVAIGGAGGALYVGVLTAWWGVSPPVAAATSLATLFPTTLVGAWSHYRQGNVRVRLGLPLLVAGMIGSLAGSLATGWIPAGWQRRVLACVMIYALWAIGRAVLARWRARSDPRRQGPSSEPRTTRALGWGLAGGMLSGLTGLSGSTPISAGLLAMGCSPLEAAGTSLFALTGLCAVGFGMHLGMGHVDARLAVALCVGTMAGSAAGPKLLALLPRRPVEAALGPVLFLLVLAVTVVLLVR
jgi:hypothetical protein